MRVIIGLLALLASLPGYADNKFKVVVLGCGGGPQESNLSSYLLAPKESNAFIALDAGTLFDGITLAIEKNSFLDIPGDPNTNSTQEEVILRDHIKAYLISHAHLDHVAGLVLNSPYDRAKPIFGIASTIDYIRDYLFNGKIWPNFGSEGKKPRFNLYQYERLKPAQKKLIPSTEMSVEAFLLSHPDGYPSTAFLLTSRDAHILYCGDTSPDALEKKKHLQTLWRKIAPLIRDNKLSAIFLECSYPNRQPADHLYGHLEPKFMMEEFHTLARLVDPVNPLISLKNVKVVVTHIKNSPVQGPSAATLIRQELENLNDLSIPFIFPEQGQRLEL